MRSNVRLDASTCAIVVSTIIAAICVGCGIFYAWASWRSYLAVHAPRCSPPSEGFSEKALVGEWVAGSPEHQDTLIIAANGTYKQTIHVEFAERLPLDYESEWQAWRLEYSPEGIPYLHLTGFAFCGMNPDIPCEQRDGGGYDFCQDKYLPMQGEGILIVLETPAGGYLYLHYPLGSENSYAYRKRER